MHKRPFKTTDPDLAASLIAELGERPWVEVSPEGGALFYFEVDEYVDEFVARYGRYELRVEPVTYSSALRYLRTEALVAQQRGFREKESSNH